MRRALLNLLKRAALRRTRDFMLALAIWPALARSDGTPLLIDKTQVIELVRQQSPSLRVAKARAEEVRAARIGAGAAAQTNPELSASAGPRFLPQGSTSFDFNLALSWPFDVSGAPKLRAELADERVLVAEAEAADAERIALGEALALWAQCRAAEERLALEAQRANLDAALLHIAQVRRDAGAVGDGDVALATLLQAEGQARLRTAEGEREATQVLLRGRLGLSADTQLSLPSVASIDTTLPHLEEIFSRLEKHPDLVRAVASAQAAAKDADLQRRLGLPTPKLILVGERSPEYAAHAGVDVALPVYQRNQTNRAVIAARIMTASAEESAIRVRVEVELRAAYARLTGAGAAYEELGRAVPAIDDTEHLATRGYELGQVALAAVVTARREAAGARAALLDAKETLIRARVVVDLASGAL